MPPPADTTPPQPADSAAQATPPLRTLAPVDPPMVPFVLAGIAGWALIGLVLWLLRSELAQHGRQEWLSICGYGLLLGVPGLVIMLVHDAGRRRHR